MKLRKLSLVTVLVGLLCLATTFAANTPAQAEYITSGTEEYCYPTVGSVSNSLSFTAPFTESDQLIFAVQNTITSNSIDIIMLGYFLPWYSAAFNGEVFKMPSDTIPGISVSQNMGATVTFDKHDIYVNFQGLYSNPGNYVDINIVPEPCTILLFCSGLAGLFGIRRKFKT